MTSPGRMAEPDGRFSAAPIRPVTRTGASRAASADSAAITAAPPAMSPFIVFMASFGFSDRPPLSNVMPLPISTTWSRAPPGS